MFIAFIILKEYSLFLNTDYSDFIKIQRNLYFQSTFGN